MRPHALSLGLFLLPVCFGFACTEGNSATLVLELSGGQGGGAGDPCEKRSDCADGLLCIDEVCAPECSSDNECESNICGPENQCIECRTLADCPEDDQHACTAAGECVECVADADCGAYEPHCYLERNRCVECLTSADCASNNCDTESHQCESD